MIAPSLIQRLRAAKDHPDGRVKQLPDIQAAADMIELLAGLVEEGRNYANAMGAASKNAAMLQYAKEADAALAMLWGK